MQLITTLSLVIHLIVCYREQYMLHPHFSEELVTVTLDRMSIPSVFVILTSVAGFGSLMTCDIVPIIDLGTMMNIGVSISLITSYLLFPAIMVLLKKKEFVLTFDHYFTLNETFAQLVELPQNHFRLSFLLHYLVCKVHQNWSLKIALLTIFKKRLKFIKGMTKIDHNLGGTTPFEIVIRFPKAEAKATAPEASTTPLDSFEEEFEGSKEGSQYWFTAQKMEMILKVHDYLEARPEIETSLL